MIKYYMRTFHRLPPSKWIMDSQTKIPGIIDEMIAAKPARLKLTRDDLFNSVSIVTIDTEKLPFWKEIFSEFIDWDWIDLESSAK